MIDELINDKQRDDLDNQQLLNELSITAQEYIFLFLKDYVEEIKLNNIMNTIKNIEIISEKIKPKENDLGKELTFAGMAYKDKIIMDLSAISDSELNKDKILGNLIHEYSHIVMRMNSKYSQSFEEAVASIFSEIVINNYRQKVLNDNKLFEMLDSKRYQDYISEVKSILYVLSIKQLDIKLLIEYITGDQNKFINECINIFGNKIHEIIDTMSNTYDNKKTDTKIINLLTQYIIINGLSIKNYVINNNSLYLKRNHHLDEAIKKAGIDYFKREHNYFYLIK